MQPLGMDLLVKLFKGIGLITGCALVSIFVGHLHGCLWGAVIFFCLVVGFLVGPDRPKSNLL